MRPSWDDTWMDVAETVAKRSRCVRRQAGVVIVSATNRVVAVGYNGPARQDRRAQLGDCSEWCPRAKTGGSLSYDDCVAVHSEPNALMHADRSLMEGGTLYVTSAPCLTCAKDVANSGITRVVMNVQECDRERSPELAIAQLETCKIEVTIPYDVRLFTRFEIRDGAGALVRRVVE